MFAKQQALRILGQALKDSKTANQLAPSQDEVVQFCKIANSIAWETKDRGLLSESLKILTEILSGGNLPTQRKRASIMSLRANTLDQLDEDDAAIQEFTEAIRLDPENPLHYESRAEVYQNNGLRRQAVADLAKAQKLREGDVQVEWKGKWYSAVILKTEGERYYIHYSGFGDEWNEWVTKDRLRKK